MRAGVEKRRIRRGLAALLLVAIFLCLIAGPTLTTGRSVFADDEDEEAPTLGPTATAASLVVDQPPNPPPASYTPTPIVGAQTPTPTATVKAAGRAGAVATVTASPDLSSSPTATPTGALTATPSVTVSSTPSETPTATSTPTASPTATPSVQSRFLVPDDQPDDYALVSGRFFSQSVPGAPRGFGFSVSDDSGAPFWQEYLRLGGLDVLGYPLSRRFIRDGVLLQAFQGGLLRWLPEQSQADLVTRSKATDPPREAFEPEPPARLGATAAHQPWSGWWWPANSLVRGPHLFDADGPLAKYDQFVARNGRDDPGTLSWERSELAIEGLSWAGHCNGWAAAALLEDEPTDAREAGGVIFSVGDQKGLLSAYYFAVAAAWLDGDADADVTPLDLHSRLVQWFGVQGKGFIFTFRPSEDQEVWSYPAYRFELTMSPDPELADATYVVATVWLADNDVPADFVGLQPWRGKPRTYQYRLYGPRDAPTDGEWAGDSLNGGFAHPALIWYPDARVRNLDRELSSPNLNYDTIRKITRKK